VFLEAFLEGDGTTTHGARAKPGEHRKKRRARMVTPGSLERWASRHLDRYSSSAANLRFVLQRRVRRVETELATEFPEAAAWIDQLIRDLEVRGYLDDRAYALGLARQMRARGSSERRIQARLYEKGIPREVAGEVIGQVSGAGGDFEAALETARRRRLGPFRSDPEERRARRERDLAALGRSGFSYEVAARIIDAEHDPEDISARHI